MTCQYCRAQNHPEDHRCGRCGRRVGDDSVRRPTTVPVQQSAAAPKLETVEAPASAAVRPGPQLVRDLPGTAPASRDVVQPSLFGPRGAAAAAAAPKPRPPRRRPDPSAQGVLDFDQTADGSHTLPTSVEAALYSDARVALTAQRVMAGAVDVLIPLAGFAVFAAAFYFKAGSIDLNVKTAPYFCAAVLIIMLFYRVVCCLGDMDTPGAQWAGMRLLDFDGRLPTRRARARRIAGGMLSVISVGLGLLWALFDEEKLTWHDHMSGTFPTIRYRL
jgi:uncharacterized RDD family membrane protein YckC